jgi:lysophospholipase L1-like esterase
MLECLILGDSIAVGIAQHRPECVAYAKIGITSRAWNNKFLTKNLESNITTISLGTNDHSTLKTFEELFTLRQTLSGKVQWVLPANGADRQAPVVQVAKIFGDTTLLIPELARDKIHPTSKAYKQLAEKIRQ